MVTNKMELRRGSEIRGQNMVLKKLEEELVKYKARKVNQKWNL